MKTLLSTCLFVIACLAVGYTAADVVFVRPALEGSTAVSVRLEHSSSDPRDGAMCPPPMWFEFKTDPPADVLFADPYDELTEWTVESLEDGGYLVTVTAYPDGDPPGWMGLNGGRCEDSNGPWASWWNCPTVLWLEVEDETTLTVEDAFIQFCDGCVNRAHLGKASPITIEADEGACCMDSGGCWTTTQYQCEQHEYWTWIGGDCEETDCEPYSVYGACCKENGSCHVHTATGCASYQWTDDYTFFAEGATCEEVNCTPVGCCYWDSADLWLLGARQDWCVDHWGEWHIECDGYNPFKATARK